MAKKEIKQSDKKDDKRAIKIKVESKELKPRKIEIRNEKDIAMDFAAKVHRRFSDLIKATVLFGSQVKGTAKTKSDVDIVIIVDDASVKWDLELVAWYREELGKLISGNQYEKELHINTVKLTTWWQDLMRGDPVVINIIRYGETLIDIGGFFKPLKILLQQGKIHSTPEAVYAALQRAPSHLARSKAAELNSIEGIYWSMVDSAHAALITAGKLPPSPEHVPELLNETFVDSGMLKASYVNSFRELYALHRQIAHGEISSISGVEIDQWQKNAENFLIEMTRIIDMLIETRKNLQETKGRSITETAGIDETKTSRSAELASELPEIEEENV